MESRSQPNRPPVKTAVAVFDPLGGSSKLVTGGKISETECERIRADLQLEADERRPG